MNKVYYKIQYYDQLSLTWKDIQKQFDSISDAENHTISTDGKKRIMQVDGKKRSVMTV